MLKSDADRDLIAAVEAVRRGEPYVSCHADALLPASPRSTPLFMLLAESDLLTAHEREQVRLVAKADATFALTKGIELGSSWNLPGRPPENLNRI